jgi:hypothetical protein
MGQLDQISPAMAAKVLDVTPSRVRQLLATGLLPYVRTPLGRLIDAAGVERLRLEREHARVERAAEDAAIA